jgi:multidrug resistance efflux pump
MRILAIFVLGLIIGVGGALTFRQSEGGGRSASTDESPADGDDGSEFSPPASGLRERQAIVALGTLEPRDGIVQISSPLIGYHVKEVRARDGQLVKPGAVLVELDASSASAEHEFACSQLAEAIDRQQTEISLAKQRVASARLAVQQAAEGRELELAVQRSRIAVAEAKEKQATKDGARLEDLSKLPEPLASQQQVEGQRLLIEGAAAEREGAQVALRRLEQSLTFQQQTAEAELRAAEQSLTVAEKGTGVESLRRRVELAKLKLDETTILAPAGGVILGVAVHPGEVVSQQPLL